MAEKFDAIVIGGGPGGATAALLLARADWKVAVIEKAHFPRRKVCGEYVSATNLPLFRQLGIEADFQKVAGPPVNQVGLFARETIVSAPMPRMRESPDGWGRALGRETLDALLLNRAAETGAHVWQPWWATKLRREGGAFVCESTNKETGGANELQASVVIAAHGSWEPGALPTQPARRALGASDLLGFKAHFRGCRLPVGLMPLVVFPGGYGGMVHTSDGRVSFSCCIRRDELERCRRAAPSAPAGEAVLAHVRQSCRGVREAVQGASLDGAWLSAGPIRPGIVAPFSKGMFCVGNAVGEAHPVIAEGISMAMQSAWLLCEQLVARSKEGLTSQTLHEIGSDYAAAWRRSFAWRIRLAALFAHLAARPAAVELLLPLFRLFPATLTRGARWSGKANEVVQQFGHFGPSRSQRRCATAD
ncbi:MAG: FAD-dependent oxidoreductase [Verrucomicrobia bacterium]|nr:MAG: FAD-dependent oxidoreductase [Verrucomicrobiota bacterium]